MPDPEIPMLRERHVATFVLVLAMGATSALAHETAAPTAAARDLIARLPLIDERGQPRHAYAEISYNDVALLADEGSLKSVFSGYWWPDHYEALLELADEATSAEDAVGFGLENIERMALLSFPRSAYEYPAVVQLRQVDEAVLRHAWAGAGYRQEAGHAFHARQGDGGKPPAFLSDALDYRVPYLHMAPTAAVLRTMREAPTQGGALSRGDIGNIFAALDGELGQGERLSMFRLLIRSQELDSDAVRAEYGNEDALPFYSAMMMAEARTPGQAPQALVAISWADCAVARQARDFVAAKWETLAPGDTAATAGRAFELEGEWRVLPVASACVLLGRILTGEAEEPSPFPALSRRLDEYQLQPFQPGPLPPL